MHELFQNWKSWVWGGSTIVAAGILGIIVSYILFQIVTRLAKSTSPALHDSFVKHCRRPFRLTIPLLTVHLLLPLLSIPENIIGYLSSIFSSLLIVSIAWLLIQSLSVMEELILHQYKIGDIENLHARKIYTQVQIIRKMLIVVIVVLALASILMSYERFQKLGTGILASAGIVSIIIVLAAQRTFGNFLAGIQIAFTQPIRMNDVVIVENEWGIIEEITLTYVVVKIWDLRRLILPISYFLEKPFQNWTRVSADLLGTVYLYVDYRTPVQEIRDELHRILQNSNKWDGRIWGLQVTNSTERTIELRALMSAPDSSITWDLRCDVREKLIEFIQKNHPDVFPTMRAEIHEPGGNKNDTYKPWTKKES